MTKTDTLSLEAKHSIMVYADGDRSVAVLYDKKDKDWTNARSLSHDDLLTLCGSELKEPPALLPAEMLWYVEDKIMVWYCKPHIGTIICRKAKKKYRHPGLVFCVRRSAFGNDKLSIAVVNKSDPNFRPLLSDPLYRSPYAGIDVHPHQGQMGNCHVIQPNPRYAFSLEYDCWLQWQEAFLESGFNKQPKPRNKLTTINTTLGDWINAHTNEIN